MRLVRHAMGLQRGLVGRSLLVDARVVLRVVDQQRRLDPGDVVGRLRGGAIERHAGIQAASHLHREEIDHAAAKAEAGGAQLPVRQLVGLEIPGAVEKVRAQLAAVEAPLHLLAVVVVAGIAADGRETVRRQREKPRHRGTPRDVLDVRIQAPVLVDDENRGKRTRAGRPDQVAPHPAGVAAGRIVLDVARLDALVGKGDRLRPGVSRQHRLGHRQRRPASDNDDGGGASKELAAVHAAMAVLVIQVVDLRIDQMSVHRGPPFR